MRTYQSMNKTIAVDADFYIVIIFKLHNQFCKFSFEVKRDLLHFEHTHAHFVHFRLILRLILLHFWTNNLVNCFNPIINYDIVFFIKCLFFTKDFVALLRKIRIFSTSFLKWVSIQIFLYHYFSCFFETFSLWLHHKIVLKWKVAERVPFSKILRAPSMNIKS